MTRFLASRHALAALIVAALPLTVAVARRDAAAACRDGLVRAGTRCCPLRAGVARCASPIEENSLSPPSRIALPARSIRVRGQSFERPHASSSPLHLASIALGSTEVSCADALAILGSSASPITAKLCSGDPQRAAGGLRLEDARRVCAALGGRLPTETEWMGAAGGGGTRYPWGETGATCRAAVWAMVAGPCAHGADGPDTVHSRPGGTSPDGLEDLAGNVAEWALREGDAAVLKGGDYASVDPAALRVFAWRPAHAEEADPRNGARCAFDPPN